MDGDMPDSMEEFVAGHKRHGLHRHTVRGGRPDDPLIPDGTPIEVSAPMDGPFDPDELVRWAETYGHPETWAQKAKEAHKRLEAAEANVREYSNQVATVESEWDELYADKVATLARAEEAERLLTESERSVGLSIERYGHAAALFHDWLVDGPPVSLGRLEAETRDWLGER